MKNLVFALAALAGLSMASNASAHDAYAHSAAPIAHSAPMVHSAPIVYSGPVVHSAPVATSSRVVVRRSSSRGLFGNLIELERRKNAWLRRTFLGR